MREWQSWEIALVSVVLPAIVTVLFPHLSARLKARLDARKTDAEVGAELRDELRHELDRLKAELNDVRERQRDCEADRDRMGREIATLQGQVLTLQEQSRKGRGDGYLGRAGGMGA